jgi:hypothetical protein
MCQWQIDPNAAKAGGLQIRRCQGFAVDDCGGTLGALSLKPSGFCSIGVDFSKGRQIWAARKSVSAPLLKTPGALDFS